MRVANITVQYWKIAMNIFVLTGDVCQLANMVLLKMGFLHNWSDLLLYAISDMCEMCLLARWV